MFFVVLLNAQQWHGLLRNYSNGIFSREDIMFLSESPPDILLVFI